MSTPDVAWMKARTFHFPSSSLTAPIVVFEGSDENALIDEAVRDGTPTPYGVVVWASAMATAAHLAGRAALPARIVDVGAGCGLVPLVCAARGCKTVALDHSPPARALIRAGNEANGLNVEIGDFDILAPAPLPAGDLYLFVDMLYEPALMAAIVRRLREIIAQGARALVADPDRFSRETFELALGTEGIPFSLRKESAAPFGFDRTTVYFYDVGHDDDTHG